MHGKPPIVKAEPIRATKLKTSIIDEKLNEEQKTSKRSSSLAALSKPGLKIGGVDKEHWRCATCKFSNDNEQDQCNKCHDPKKILIEPKV